LLLTFGAWWAFDRATLAIPWAYAARSATAALPYLFLLPLAFVRLPTRLIVLVAVLGTAATTIAWGYLIRRLGLLNDEEVPLLHQSRHGPVRLALRYLAPSDR